MSYQVKEIYYTLQGEGARTGRAAVFLRFAGCNLWSGHERDRQRAVCKFCDTDFVGVNGVNGGRFANADELGVQIAALWPKVQSSKPYVVCTGGEPLLQIDSALIHALHARRFEIGIESNGTIEAPPGLDWICVSPKAEAEVVQRSGDELKLVYPQRDAPPERFASLDFKHFFLQPMDSSARDENTRATAEYCLGHPQWRLSLQTHKLIGLP